MYNSKSAQIFAVKMADMMTEAYGPPLLEVGHTLTSEGIVRYSAYERAKEVRSPHYFNVHGDMHGPIFHGKEHESFYRTLAVPVRERTIEDWLMITSKIPEGFESDQRLKSMATSNSEASFQNPEASDGGESQGRVLGEALIELKSVVVKYGTKTVLGHPPPQLGFTEPGLNLTIRRGTRLALLGPNGSGKTTLLSLLTSDHPHSYSLPIQFFGRSRLPQLGKPGLSLWEIQSRIGHSSPEVHGFFPRSLTIRKVLESAWAETYGAKPKMTWENDEMVDAFLRWWEPELRQVWPRAASSEVHETELKDRKAWLDSLPKDMNEDARRKLLRKTWVQPEYKKSDIWKMMQQSYPPLIHSSSSCYPSLESDDGSSLAGPESDTSLDWAEDTRNHTFGLLPFGTQRLLLLLRAIIKEPEILVLDEAFSGLSPEARDKAMCWLEHGETMFFQGHVVGTDGKIDGTGNHERGNEEEQEADFAGNAESNVRRGPGRPRSTLPNVRPPPQPGRPPGRPKGALTGSGPTPWAPKSRREVELEGEKRWEMVKVTNMRRTVERVCKTYDIDVAELGKGRLSSWPYKVVQKCGWEELMETAETGLGRPVHPTNGRGNKRPKDNVPRRGLEEMQREYRFRGLSQKQAMVVVSHVREEVPGVVDEWLRLPGEEEVVESGRTVEMGRCDDGSIRTVEGWGKVWGL